MSPALLRYLHHQNYNLLTKVDAESFIYSRWLNDTTCIIAVILLKDFCDFKNSSSIVIRLKWILDQTSPTAQEANFPWKLLVVTEEQSTTEMRKTITERYIGWLDKIKNEEVK